ncbi:MAG: hypothetical protein ACTSP7_06495 [Candidatus Heimdallarchaeota archaeon]
MTLKVAKNWWKKTSVVLFLMVIILFMQFSSIGLLKGEAINADLNFGKTSLGENPTEGVYFTPNEFLLEEAIKISNTGLNSTHTRIEYYPETQLVGISWVDQVNPFTPNPSSSINYAIGNRSDLWPSYTLVTTVLDTLIQGYSPAIDGNETVHITYEKFGATKYDINDLQLDNGTVLQSEVNVATNAGNSTFPVSIFDNEGIVHLVWIDDSNNPQGDIFYTHFNTTTDLWTTPIVQVTTGADIVTSSPPSLVVDNNNTVHLVWADKRSGNQELYYSYLNESAIWSTEEKITNVPIDPIQPVIAYNNLSKELTVLYRDSGTTDNLYFIEGPIKTNVTSWTSPITVSEILADNSDYDICVDQLGTVITVFEEEINPNRIYIRQKSVSSSSFKLKKYISDTSYAAHDPAITISENDELFIVYTLKQGASADVYLISGFIDTDGDGLADLDEVKVHGTDYTLIDTDGDTISDGDEILVYGTNPLSLDSDTDLMPDDFEINNNLDPINSTDAADDIEMDNLTNLEEFNAGTNPRIGDTDQDTLLDGNEVKIHFTDPLSEDTDGDQLEDGFEVFYGLDPLVIDDANADPDNDGLPTITEALIWTDPTNPDTDGDGFSDGIEYLDGTDPLDPNDFPYVAPVRDYTDLIIAIAIGAVSVIVILSLALLVARQFRPEKSRKRKELEMEGRELFSEHTEKEGKVTWEEKERDSIESAAKKRFEEKQKVIEEEKLDPKSEVEPAAVEKYDIPDPTFTTPKKEELDINVLQKKKDQLAIIISALEDYEKLLEDILKNKMTDHAILTASREGLTEFAAESQTIYSEAKTLWDGTIIPLIKGYEEPLYSETVKAEEIIDCCEQHNNKILEILVQRELDFTEEEERREDVKDIARKALEKIDSEEESSTEDVDIDNQE